jgi:hypothetical protein
MPEVSCFGGSARAPSRSTGPSTSQAIRHYSVADRIICFQGVDEPALDLVHNFLSGYYFTPVDSSGVRNQPVHLIEIHKSAPPAVPSKNLGFEIEDGYCYPGHEQVVLVVNGSTIVVSAPALNRTDVWLSDTTAARHPLALNNVILYAVQAALRRGGMYQFHAGCVLPPDATHGILLVGDSGCGKSTLTATLILNGWRFVSDDNLLLRDKPSGVVAWALRRYFTFDESTLDACKLRQFPDAIGSRVPGDRDKVRFYARRAFPDSFVETCVPGVILFPAIGAELQTRIEPLKPGDALARLLRQCPWATCDTAAAPDHVQALTNLVTQTRNYSVIAGQDVFDSPSSIPSLISQGINE